MFTASVAKSIYFLVSSECAAQVLRELLLMDCWPNRIGPNVSVQGLRAIFGTQHIAILTARSHHTFSP